MMIEKTYAFSTQPDKKIEKIVDDDNLIINHMLLPKGESLPEHFSNSNVYLVIVIGYMNLVLDEQSAHRYTRGDIVNIPYHTKMNIINVDEDILEFFVIKAPNPKDYKEQS